MNILTKSFDILNLLPPANAAGNAFGRVCLSVCPLRAQTFESLDLETSFLVCGYVIRIARSVSCITVIRSTSKSEEQKWSN